MATDFQHRLEQKLRQQLASQRVGYLLGAGASHLNGSGYPLASQLWDLIQADVPPTERCDIQTRLDQGAEGIEQALDLLDDGGVADLPHRHSVTAAIAAHFGGLDPPTATHQSFLQRVAKRPEPCIPVFCLNYDPLLERAAERSRIPLIDGFQGVEHAFFDSQLFQHRVGTAMLVQGRRRIDFLSGIVHLFKLHGSMGWYECPTNGVRRCGFGLEIPGGTKRLMIPPQRRKASDTMAPPYAGLWSEFRRWLRHGPSLVHRLACIGYGMRDEHVNAVIENGLARNDLTLLICAKHLTDPVFDRWSRWQNVIIVTEARCSLYGETGPGHVDLWRFERLREEV